jgi:hypothetical protein
VWMIMLDSGSLILMGIVTQSCFLGIIWLLLFLMANAEFRKTAVLEKMAKNQLDREN